MRFLVKTGWFFRTATTLTFSYTRPSTVNLCNSSQKISHPTWKPVEHDFSKNLNSSKLFLMEFCFTRPLRNCSNRSQFRIDDGSNNFSRIHARSSPAATGLRNKGAIYLSECTWFNGLPAIRPHSCPYATGYAKGHCPFARRLCSLPIHRVWTHKTAL